MNHMKRLAFAALLAVALGSAANGQSTVNPNMPAASSTLTSAPIRGNFAAAVNDINNIVGAYPGASAPLNPAQYQLWRNNSVTPQLVYQWTGSAWVQVSTFDVTNGKVTPYFGDNILAWRQLLTGGGALGTSGQCLISTGSSTVPTMQNCLSAAAFTVTSPLVWNPSTLNLSMVTTGAGATVVLQTSPALATPSWSGTASGVSLALSAATASTTTTTGALTVVGGAGIGGAVNIGGDFSLPSGKNYKIGSLAWAYANPSNTAQIRIGGMGGGPNLYLGGAGDSTAYFDIDTLNFRSGAGAGYATFGSTGLGISATTASTSTATGALTVAGGVGVAGAVYAGDVIQSIVSASTGSRASLQLLASNSDAATGRAGIGIQNTNGGGGLTIQQDPTGTGIVQNAGTANVIGWYDRGGNNYLAFAGGTTLANTRVSVLSTQASTSTTTGALTVAGGVGVAGAINAGGVVKGSGLDTTGGAITSNNLTYMSLSGPATYYGTRGSTGGAFRNGASGAFTFSGVDDALQAIDTQITRLSAGVLSIDGATAGSSSGSLRVSGLTVTGSFTATGLVTNASLANPSTTVNGQTCTLGGACTITASAGTISIGVTTVSSGTSGNILYNNAGVLGNLGVTGSGVVVEQISPSLVTPALGAATGTSLALGGASIGSNALSVTGTASISGAVTTSNQLVSVVATGTPPLSITSTTLVPNLYVARAVLADTASAVSASALTGATLASGVTASSLTSVGTLTGGATGAGFTLALSTSTLSGQVGLTNLPTLGANTVLGSIAGGTPIALTTAQHTALVNTFTTSLSGAVPAPGTATGKLLSDAGWVAPPTGAGTVTSVSAGTGMSFTTITGTGSVSIDKATAANYFAGTASKVLTADNVYQAETTTTYGATTSLDFSTFYNTAVTLTGNITTISCSNQKAGQSGAIRFIQDATGSRTLPATFGCNMKFSGGSQPILTTTPSAVDTLVYACNATNYCVANLIKNVQ